MKNRFYATTTRERNIITYGKFCDQIDARPYETYADAKELLMTKPCWTSEKAEQYLDKLVERVEKKGVIMQDWWQW